MAWEHGLYLLACGFAASFVWMTLLWAIALKIKNYAIVDVGWGVSLFLYCVVYFYPIHGVQSKDSWILIIVGFWAMRLSGHLLFDRLVGHREEGRYKKLREVFKNAIPFKFFLFFQAQALFNAILSLPFLMVAMDYKIDHLHFWDLMAVLIAAVAIFGETLADDQLKKFKLDPKNKGKVCDVGLWKYSRHPNYFFEFMVWIGFSIFGLTAQYGWLGLIAPACILWTLLKLTGIPATEEQSLRSRGDLYRVYQARVSRFVPWFPKKS